MTAHSEALLHGAVPEAETLLTGCPVLEGGGEHSSVVRTCVARAQTQNSERGTQINTLWVLHDKQTCSLP